MTQKTRDILIKIERDAKSETADLINQLYDSETRPRSLLTDSLWYLSQVRDNLSDPERLTDSDFLTETLESLTLTLEDPKTDPETRETLSRLRDCLTRLSFSVFSLWSLQSLEDSIKSQTKDLEILESLINLTVSLETLTNGAKHNDPAD